MSEILSIIKEDNRPPTRFTSELGIRGERLAAEHLVGQGYRLVAANFRVPIGRNQRGVAVTGEIDIIALDGETITFVEVKTRRSDEFTPILRNVNLRKQRQIIRAAKVYRRIFDIRDMPFRYDVVTVLIPSHTETKIELIKGFWSESQFRKSAWSDDGWYDGYQ